MLKSIFTQTTTKLQWVTDFVGRYLAIVNSSINFLIYCLVAFRSTKTFVKLNWGGANSHGSNSFGVLLLTKLIGNVRKETSRANHELNVLQLATKTRIPRSFSQQRIILGIYTKYCYSIYQPCSGKSKQGLLGTRAYPLYPIIHHSQPTVQLFKRFHAFFIINSKLYEGRFFCTPLPPFTPSRSLSGKSFQVGSQFRESLARLFGRNLKTTQPIIR